MSKDQLIQSYLACPECKTKLRLAGDDLECVSCNSRFQAIDGIYSLLPGENMYPVKPEHWDQYKWKFVEEAHGATRMKKVLKYINHEGTHLDIGTGRGDGTYLVGKKKQTIGVDYGLDSLRIAKEKNPHVFHADGRHLPFQNGSFSSITMMDVIEHLPNPEKLLLEANRVLKPRGTMILQTPTIEASRLKDVAAKIYNRSKTMRSLDTVIQRLRPDVPVINPNVGAQPYDVLLRRKQLHDMILSAGFTIEKRRLATYFSNILLIQLFCFADLYICRKGE
ncbi:methyltransferase domain-containing protein [Candidatus Poribacteria bacterium]|nr:methyltransferase domain-containing protein [Candidatus Poribacteria bacterium]